MKTDIRAIIVIFVISIACQPQGDHRELKSDSSINSGIKLDLANRLKVDSLTLKETEFGNSTCYVSYFLTNISESPLSIFKREGEVLIQMYDSAVWFNEVAMLVTDQKIKNDTIMETISFPEILLTDSASRYREKLDNFVSRSEVTFSKMRNKTIFTLRKDERIKVTQIFDFSSDDLHILRNNPKSIKFKFNFRYFVNSDTSTYYKEMQISSFEFIENER